MKRIMIDIPDSVAETLTIMATARGTTVPAMIVGASVALSRSWTRPFQRQVAELHADGLSTAQIAAELAVPNNRVLSALHKMNISPNPPGRPVEHVTARSLVLAGYTDAEIAEHFGISLEAAARRRRSFGLPPNRRYTRSQQ